MFDVGWQELGLIAVVALLVLGPKELPGLMRTAGQLTRKARAIANEFRFNLENMAEEAELEEYKRTALQKAAAEEPLLPPPAAAANPSPVLNADSAQAPAIPVPEEPKPS